MEMITTLKIMTTINRDLYMVVASDEDSVTNNINNNDIHNNNSNGIEDLQSQG